MQKNATAQKKNAKWAKMQTKKSKKMRKNAFAYLALPPPLEAKTGQEATALHRLKSATAKKVFLILTLWEDGPAGFLCRETTIFP